jgi:hypothetical protein
MVRRAGPKKDHQNVRVAEARADHVHSEVGDESRQGPLADEIRSGRIERDCAPGLPFLPQEMKLKAELKHDCGPAPTARPTSPTVRK